MAWFGRKPAVSRPTAESERSPLRANAEAAAGRVVPLEKVVDLLAARAPTEAEIAEAYREYLAVVGSPVPADLTVVAMRQLRYRAWYIGYEERMAAAEKRLDDLARRAIAAGWEGQR